MSALFLTIAAAALLNACRLAWWSAAVRTARLVSKGARKVHLTFTA